MERKAIGPKLRFEVFKRDSFTCQYCGKKAPEIILRVDHINPVKNDGDNNILNLITSCFECNSGKGATLLTDNTMLDKQRKQLEELQERKCQLEMMVQWREELMSFEDETAQIYLSKIEDICFPYTVSDNFLKKLKKMMKTYSATIILDSIQESFDRHILYLDNGDADQRTVETFLNKIPGIAYFKSQTPTEKKVSFISLVASKKFNCHPNFFKGELSDLSNNLNDKFNESFCLKTLQNHVYSTILKECYNEHEFISEVEAFNEEVKNHEGNKEYNG